VLVQPLPSVPVTVYVVVDAGVTETVVPESDPGIHAYVDAPPPVSVTELPVQIVVLDALAVIDGAGFTVIVRVDVLVQPFAAVPVTVYVVVVAGETVTVVPVSDPGIHAYVDAPPPVSVVLLPAQMVAPDVVVVTVGEGLTVIMRVAVPVHPAVVPVTVYVVVPVGETVTVVPVSDPGIHVYVVAPEAVMVVLFPEQIVPPVVVVVTVGDGVTVTSTVCVLVQPFAPVPVTVYVVVPAGVTVTVVPVSDPGIHAYVDAPDPVNVVLLPAQMDGLPAVAATVGEGFTVITRVAVFVQPFAAVPVTVYVVVPVGETVTVVPVSDPGIQVYVDAPPPVIVVLLPAHIVAPDVVVVTVGEGLTVMTRVAVAEQPVEVPITVYVVVPVGETVTVVPVSDPGIQVYVVAPDAVIVVLLPEQIVELVVVVVTVGVGFTLIVRVAVLVQPFAPVPVTVNVVVVEGETTMFAPVNDPGIQVYDVPPDAMSVAALPEQIVGLVVVTVMFGAGFTVIVRVAVFVQPFAFVPVTVYVVVPVGETVTGLPVSDPGIQVYDTPPFAVMVVLLPAQIVPPDVVVVIVGSAFTVTTSVCVPVPFALVAVCVTVYVPAVFQITLATFCVVAEFGVPLGKVQVHDVGLFVELSVKLSGVPRHTVVALAVNAAFGITDAGATMFTLSM